MSRLTLRKRSRKLVLESLYAWQIAKTAPDEIMRYKCDMVKKEFDESYYRQVFYGVLNSLDSIDACLQQYTSRALNEIGPIELALLRLSVYEFQRCLDIPYKVVINEGLRLAKKFGAQDSYKFVNGVLDKVANDLRAVEKKGSAS